MANKLTDQSLEYDDSDAPLVFDTPEEEVQFGRLNITISELPKNYKADFEAELYIPRIGLD